MNFFWIFHSHKTNTPEMKYWINSKIKTLNKVDRTHTLFDSGVLVEKSHDRVPFEHFTDASRYKNDRYYCFDLIWLKECDFICVFNFRHCLYLRSIANPIHRLSHFCKAGSYSLWPFHYSSQKIIGMFSDQFVFSQNLLNVLMLTIFFSIFFPIPKM